MPDQSVLNFLLSRRSKPALALSGEPPDAATLRTMLTAAVRVPDHGKLEPWRFLLIEGAARERLSDALVERGTELEVDTAKLEKSARLWRSTPLIVAVVSAPKPVAKVPAVEQVLSAGAVCLSLVNAAEAMGWGAVWLTGWQAFDRAFVEGVLGLGTDESIAGFVHIGRCDTAVPDRPRPDIDAITTRLTT